MKCILASAPEVKSEFVKDFIQQELKKLTGKNIEDIKVAVILDASALDEQSHWWLIEHLKCLVNTFPKNVWLFNLFALDNSQTDALINRVDVIWTCGGSADFLKVVFDRSGLADRLPQILKDKVYVGSSAGSCVMGRRGDFDTLKSLYVDDIWYDIDDYYGVINACIYPHIFTKHTPTNAYDIAVNASKILDYPCYSLSDSSAIVINGDDTYLIGKNAQKLVNGNVVEQV